VLIDQKIASLTKPCSKAGPEQSWNEDVVDADVEKAAESREGQSVGQGWAAELQTRRQEELELPESGSCPKSRRSHRRSRYQYQ